MFASRVLLGSCSGFLNPSFTVQYATTMQRYGGAKCLLQPLLSHCFAPSS